MKTLALLLGLTVSLLSPLRSEDSLPNDVQQVVEKRLKGLAALNKAYAEELEKLKVKYATKVDLETANKIAALIAEVTATNPPKIETKSMWLKGRWEAVHEHPSGNVSADRTFDGLNLIDENGTARPYTIKGNVVRVDWGGGGVWFEELTIDPNEPNIMRGRNHDATKLKYIRRSGVKR